MLRGINSETVHLIATDPPFNKSKDFHATPDRIAKGARFKDRWRWEIDVHDEWVDQIQDDWPKIWAVIEAARQSHSDGMGAYICYMAVRLMEMYRVLRDGGSMFLHCDITACHYLKLILDAAFGYKNHRNDIIWQYGETARGAKAIAKQYPRNHDTIFYYTKGGEHTWNKQYQTISIPIKKRSKYGYQMDERGYFRTAPRDDYTDKSVETLEEHGRIHYTKSGNIRIKYYDQHDEKFIYKEKLLGNIWSDIPDAMHGPKSEHYNYPTRKPLELYKRIIEGSSNKGDIVLDPFCGCSTTPIAAEKLGRQWIGIDIWEGAYQIVLDRMVQEGLAVAEGEANPSRLITFGDVHYTTEIPERTDENESTVPILKIRTQRASDPWQQLPNKVIKNILAQVQIISDNPDDKVVCVGCGRQLEIEFTELDHIQPRSDAGENFITNRVLICGPCNSRKSNSLTMSGLHKENKKTKWMSNEIRAKDALAGARTMGARVRDDWDTPVVDKMISEARMA